MKFKEQAKIISSKLRFLKKRIRDPELNKVLGIYNIGPGRRDEIIKKRIDWWNTKDAYDKNSLLFTKLCVLRGLRSGKPHLSPNTRLDRLGLSSLDVDALEEWAMK